MSRWRIAVIALLLAGPILFLVGVGSYRLWQLGLGWYVWWPLSGSLALGYFLALYWIRKRRLLPPIDWSPPMQWTERDRQGWQLVEARAKVVAQQETSQFNELQYYVDVAREMSLELARIYRPEAPDPIGGRTVPEVLAVVELVAHDLAKTVKQYVPASHLLTINDWRKAKQTADKAVNWYRRFSNAYWLVSAVIRPIETSTRYLASQVGMTRQLELLQQNLVAWFHTAFVQELGRYLIELNSGRLKVGAERYRELLAQVQDGEAPAAPVAGERLNQVTLTILGQVKMGKSSFINALLGEQRAKADVLPATAEVTRYDLRLPGVAPHLVLLDTVGYSHTGPREDQLRATQQAAQQSDLLVLVLHARNPARQADVQALESLRQWFAARPELRMPPVVAVLTHVDLLSPALEWAPPYDWSQPRRPKEKNMADALDAVHEQLGPFLSAAVPVCAAEGRIYGVEEWFLPALLEQLGEAKGVALLRCLRAEADADKTRRVFLQLLNVGEQLAKVWLQRPAKR